MTTIVWGVTVAVDAARPRGPPPHRWPLAPQLRWPLHREEDACVQVRQLTHLAATEEPPQPLGVLSPDATKAASSG